MTAAQLASAPGLSKVAGPRSSDALHGRSTAARIDFHYGQAGLAAIRPEWEALASTIPEPAFFHFWEWYDCAVRHLFDEPGSFVIAVLRRHGKAQAILPLRKARRWISHVPVRCLELPNHDHMLLCDGVFSADAGDDSLDLIIQHLRRDIPGWDVLLFPRVLETSRLASDQIATPVARTQSGHCDVLPAMTRQELAAHVSKNFRGSLRKARNKLALLSGVEFYTAQAPAELGRAFEEFLEVEASGWKGTGGTASAIGLNPRVRAFYSGLVEEFGRLGRCEINVLRAEGKCIAAQFCLLGGDTCYVLKIGYDERYARIAPGNMLKEHVLDCHARDGRIRRMNLVTDAEWHRDWRPDAIPLLNTFIVNSGLRARVCSAAMKARSRLRDWMRHRVKGAATP